MDLTPLITLAAQQGCRVTEQASMAAATTFRVGGPADVLIDLPSAAAAAQVIACCRREGIPFFFLGKGSNLLVGDKGIRGAVLRLDGRQSTLTLLPQHRLYADAGLSLQRLCLYARDNGLTGLEFAYGIPGTVGGALYMNGGAYGGCMADVVVSADCLTAEGVPCTLTADELAMEYRHTALMERELIVTGVTLQLAPGDPAVIAATMKDLVARRQDKQPLEYPSAGSFFKRPEGHFAGALIEQTGLKGFRVGDAQVSEKHAGFVINRGSATAAEICELCRQVQERVWEAHGVRLEPEVRFIGEFD